MKWLALACALACTHPAPLASHTDSHDAPPLAPIGLPVPPHQQAPWTPGPGLSTELATAVATLFDQGLADPRGLDYRDVELEVGAADETRPIVATTHAWVFDRDRFAVAWNGLVYPIARAGNRADLRADIARLATPTGESWTEVNGVSATAATPLKIAMLARLGERVPALAGDPYATLATAWVDALADRAVAAHARRDHALALASARAVAIVQPAIAARHVALTGLEPIRRLLADEQRRPHARLPDPAVLAAMAPTERLDLLIDHLDDVELHAQGWGRFDDPVVIPELVKIGLPAVDRLIAVIESDPRLTRTATTGDHMLAAVGVEEVAHQALEQILDQSFFDVVPGRAKLAAEIRAFWMRWRTVPVEERWYRVLADDAAPPNDQVMSALELAQPGATGLRGDPLRAHAPPSVSALLEHRIDAAADVHDACFIAGAFHTWDPAASAGALARLEARAITVAGTTDRDGSCISDLAQLRADDGDLAGVDAYAHWLAQTEPGMFPSLMFKTASEHMTRPSVVHAIDAVFADGSPWMPLVEPGGKDSSDFLSMSLIHMAAVQKQVLAGLADVREDGTLEITAARRFLFKPNMEGGGLDSVIADAAPFVPPVGTRHSIRVCDWLGYQLARQSGAPSFELYWSEHQRDDALALLRRWLAAQAAP